VWSSRHTTESNNPNGIAKMASDGQQRRRKSLLVYADDVPTARMDVSTPWEGASKAPSAVVLDTNTLLDWLVFGNPDMAPIGTAVQCGTLIWLTCPRMREELARTLTYVDLSKWQPDAAHVLGTFDRFAQMRSTPPPSPPRLRCTDPNDQVFIDLAVASSARWLLTHDRALLKLARHAVAHGVQVLTPKAFTASVAP
jgi:uncharacterized protein